MKKAIVTLTIGGKYENLFNTYCKNNWEKYCEKFDYDLIVINQNLDDSKRSRERSPAWQKLLILSQEWANNYDQIVWVDSDVVINFNSARDISKIVEKENLGAVDAYSIPSKEIYQISLKRTYENWSENGIKYISNLQPNEYYQKRGINVKNIDSVVQTGVFVCSGLHHRKIFEHIYYNYEDINKTAEWNYEMPAMSYELIKAGLVQWIPVEYNYNVYDIISSYYSFIFFKKDFSISKFLYHLNNKLGFKSNKPYLNSLQIKCLNQIYNNGYFVHFAGCQDWIKNIIKN